MNTLGDIADVVLGFAFPSRQFHFEESEDPKVLRGVNIGQGVIRWEAGNAARWPGGEPPAVNLKVGDVALAMDRPWVSAGLKFASVTDRDVPVLLGQRVAVLRAKSCANQRFLHYVLGAPDFTKYVLAMQTGTGVPHLSGDQIRAFPVPTRSPSEQEAIANMLGALDDKIAANLRLAEIVESLMIALVISLPRSSVLDQVATLSRRQASVDELRSLSVQHYSLPAFDLDRMPALEAGATIKSSKFKIVEPTVLLSKLNPRFPRVWNVPAPASHSVASTEFLVLEPRGLSSAALWAALSSPQAASYMQARAAGTSGSHQRVRPTDVLDMPVPGRSDFPEDLMAQLTALGNLTYATRVESRTLTQLRDTLLPALMDGTIRVKDAIESTESAL